MTDTTPNYLWLDVTEKTMMLDGEDRPAHIEFMRAGGSILMRVITEKNMAQFDITMADATKIRRIMRPESWRERIAQRFRMGRHEAN